MQFHDITMINYARPLAERALSRKVAGPYHWVPNDRCSGTTRNRQHHGVGFYLAGKGMRVDTHGSIIDLRLDYANTHHRVDWRHSGAFSHDGVEEFTAIVARLPGNRGFLAGWTLGEGMASALDGTIYATIEEAADAAYDEAERACEADAEYAAEHANDCDE